MCARSLKAFLLALLLQSQLLGDIEYRLVDLGKSDIPPEHLSRHIAHMCLAPNINNHGQVTGNRAGGGFLIDPFLGEWTAAVPHAKVYFHALAHSGDILVSLNYDSNSTEWMVWPTLSNKNGPRQLIPVGEWANVHFIALTDFRMAIGNATVDGNLVPVVWKANGVLQPLTDDTKKPLKGKIKGINQACQIAALLEQESNVVPPAVWTANVGVQFLKNFRSQVLANAVATLGDVLIAEDGTVYGTYCITYIDKAPARYTYAWWPFEEGKFKLLDLDGLQIASLNDWHTLVGTLDGEAALCEMGKKPCKLSTCLPQSALAGWQLLEATSINNWGDIVGFGLYNGDVHLFLLQKENNQAPYRANLKF